jgi:hypothetical protein
MGFNIHEDLHDADGDFDEEAAEAYERELIERFAGSPEGREIGDVGVWAGMMVQYGLGCVGVTPATIDAGALGEIVFEMFPRKVSCSANDAGDIVRELQAFFSFVGREFGLVNAAECCAVLDGNAASRLARELANPANFGIAKSFFMGGRAAGFDMSSSEGIDAWSKTYNRQINAPLRRTRPMSPEERAKERNRRKRERRRAQGKR